jgi:glycopeptide antibiotics resistance protein
MEVNEIDQSKILNFKNNLNFVRKMKYFTQELLVIIVIINFLHIIYESCAIDFVVVFIVPVVKGLGQQNMQSIPLPL